MKASPWVVHKFGGTSVAGAERYRGVGQIVRRDTAEAKGIVVSAMSGVTNELIALVTAARDRDEGYRARLEALKARHLKEIHNLLPADARAPLEATIEKDCGEIGEILRGVFLARGCSDLTTELVAGYGELWSAQILSAHLRASGLEANWLDARRVLVVERSKLSVNVLWDESRKKLGEWLAQGKAPYVVITGFIASTPEGQATTLGRNGSDYSGSIFGALLDARDIVIWTDVDGVLTADPRLVPEAVVLKELSYREATELAYFGAKVVHPSTMAPAIASRIPVWIRNTFRPELPGTKIHESPENDPNLPAKGFATIDGMSLVNVEGTGMIGVPGVAQRLFGALSEVGVSVVMISQASSEHSICFVVPDAQVVAAKATVERAFFAELHHGQIQTVNVTSGCSVLAIVGDAMVEQPGIAGKFLQSLGQAGVNVRAIAQGSSERNISVVVDGPEARRALRASHSAFYLSSQTLSIGLIGAGLIGGTLLDQLQGEVERLRKEARIDLRVRGVLTSKKMWLGDPQLPLGSWRAELEKSEKPVDLKTFVDHIRTDTLPHAVLIDATASGELPNFYPQWLEEGFHLVTPNKKANTAPLEFYRRLRRMAGARNRHFLYSTTVGAGLPVLSTLRDLVRTGDKVRRIEGVLSGTLSYIFNRFDGATPFSKVVAEAKANGFTEPDPRDDLSGTDVARKLVILAREIRRELELDDVEVKNLVPEPLQKGSVDDYLEGLTQYDAEMKRLWEDAHAAGEVLRYVGTIDESGKATVDLRRLPLTHPFAALSSSDNIVAFTTERYHAQPLIIRGPGAGPAVTAAGVFSDLLRLCAYLGGAA